MEIMKIEQVPMAEGVTTESGAPVVRVAAYCRVSSLPQEESYEAQVEHFKSYISQREGWEIVKVYGDEGISGMNTKKRTGFQQMMKDAKKQQFDLILVKSISRLARNTLTAVQTIRDLKEYGIACVFEKEGINTKDAGSEMMLTMLSAFAQAESESISQNVQISMQYRAARGEYSVAYSCFLGYDRGEDGKLVVNPEQAKTVRHIYERFLAGVSLDHLAAEMTEEGCWLTGKGSTVWVKGALKKIIKNIKYTGDVRTGLTITTNVL